MMILDRFRLGSGTVARPRVVYRNVPSLPLRPAQNHTHDVCVFASSDVVTASADDGLACHVFDARVTLPDKHRSSPEKHRSSTMAGDSWMTKELSNKLVGLTAGTSRAQASHSPRCGALCLSS